jgi:hypothetical protein
MLFRRSLLALLIPAALIGAPAWAEPDIAGRWSVDKEASLISLTASKTMTPKEAADILGSFGDSAVVFEDSKMKVLMGPQSITCDWTWGAAQEVKYTACLDEKQQPAPGGPAKIEVGADGLLRFVESDGSAMTFKRAN